MTTSTPTLLVSSPVAGLLLKWSILAEANELLVALFLVRGLCRLSIRLVQFDKNNSSDFSSTGVSEVKRRRGLISIDWRGGTTDGGKPRHSTQRVANGQSYIISYFVVFGSPLVGSIWAVWGGLSSGNS